MVFTIFVVQANERINDTKSTENDLCTPLVLSFASLNTHATVGLVPYAHDVRLNVNIQTAEAA